MNFLSGGSAEDEITNSWRKWGLKNYEEKLENLLNILSLSAERDRDPLTLSIGQRRRVVMAGALASGVRVILLDEPTSCQDFHHKEALGSELNALRAAGYSFCVITRDSRFVY